MSVQLSAKLIEAFAGTFLSIRYDDAKPTPAFHREAWELYSSPCKQAMVIAPRDHAKSTALTFDYILAELCFRVSDYIILIGSTEDKAAEQLSNISEELHTNADLRAEFGVHHFDSDQKTEIIVAFDDGHRARVLARGAEQKIRGAMWKGKRPNLIVCDDMEDDEQVENKDRRAKFRRWFFRAAKQALSKSGKIRVHGTVLHEDSLLSRLVKNRTWKHLFFKAHAGYSDFSNILWPQRWSKEDLRARQQEFEEDGDAGGYSQEFLNTPQDNNEAYLKKETFIPMHQDDFDAEKLFYVGADFAVSKRDMANRTSFTVGGVGVSRKLCVVDQRVGRWDTVEWINELFLINAMWRPQIFFVEGGQIWLSVYPFIVKEMEEREIYINFVVLHPQKDKAVRGRSLQRRMKIGNVLFDKQAEWYPGYEHELLMFTGVSDAKADDQFDSTATLCIGLDKEPEVVQEDFMEEEEEEILRHNAVGFGKRSCTGY